MARQRQHRQNKTFTIFTRALATLRQGASLMGKVKLTASMNVQEDAMPGYGRHFSPSRHEPRGHSRTKGPGFALCRQRYANDQTQDQALPGIVSITLTNRSDSAFIHTPQG